MGSLRVAHFTVAATVEQSARWKQAAEAEGHRSAGTWLAAAADAYLKARARAGAPVPLAWHRGTFLISPPDGARTAVRGSVSSPFGLYRGTVNGPVRGGRTYVLLHVPTGRVLATLRHAAQCKSLAAELARTWVRWEGQGREPPGQDPGPVLDRFRREDT